MQLARRIVSSCNWKMENFLYNCFGHWALLWWQKRATFRRISAIMKKSLVFVFLTDVPKLTGFQNKKSQIKWFFMSKVRCIGETWKFFDKGFWSAFTKTLSNLGEYFGDSFSGGDKISPCQLLKVENWHGSKVLYI